MRPRDPAAHPTSMSLLGVLVVAVHEKQYRVLYLQMGRQVVTHVLWQALTCSTSWRLGSKSCTLRATNRCARSNCSSRTSAGSRASLLNSTSRVLAGGLQPVSGCSAAVYASTPAAAAAADTSGERCASDRLLPGVRASLRQHDNPAHRLAASEHVGLQMAPTMPQLEESLSSHGNACV